jgi:hypothetical protein
MGIDAIAGLIGAAAGSGAGQRLIALGPSAPAGAGASAGGASRFAAAMDQALSVSAPARADLPAPIGNMLRALDGIDVQARAITDFARTAEASGGNLTPSEMIQLTMRAQEFMFQAQLTSNIANRSAEGVQQLFRQQG